MAGCDVLVTGASGFVGRHVLDRARVAGLVAYTARGDLRDRNTVEAEIATVRPDAVIHLAAATRSMDPWLALTADVAMAGAVLSAVARHVPEAPVLITGSAAQYGLGAPRPLTEEDVTVPLSAHGAVKCTLERAVLARPLRHNVRVIFTRSFNHIGPGQPADAPAGQWARQITEGEAAESGTLRTGNLDAVRDFLDVRDVADAYLALIRSGAAGVVNVCSGVPVSLRQVADTLVRHSSVPTTIQRDAAHVRKVDPPYVVGCPQRLHELTGWRPQISLERSACDLLEMCRDEHRALGAKAPSGAA
jgi:GDP-4-dehydro-6-deoxy-D-mannose reductase